MITRSALAAALLPLLAAPALAQTAPDVAQARDAALNDTLGYEIVSGLTTEVGPRPAGSAAEARARDWAKARLTALGFKNVRIETYQMAVWERGAETAEVIAPFPQKLRVTALGQSGATPAEGITAPVVLFRSMAELNAAPAGSLAGKIAFVTHAMARAQDGSGYRQFGAVRFVGPGIAAKKGAIAIVIKSVGTDQGRGPHTGQTNFGKDVTPIPAGALSVSDAANLERMLARGAVTLKLVLTPRQIGMRESGNVIAEVPGTDPAAGIVLIGGHLDSWDLGTGAIDDGAGLAITTAAAKRLLDGPAPRRTIRVVWFGAEEVGGPGAADYFKRHGGERHALVAESDTGADRVWRWQATLPDEAKPIAARLTDALAPLGITRGDGAAGGGADVGPVARAGAAVIDLNQDASRYFDYHHTPEDTLERIDPAQLRQNIAAWTAMLTIVANAPEDIGPVPPAKRGAE
ncbi:M20/M25/M40 family metallo-hydrolase [Sphingomonas sp.]|uniref:M20/M25/M40 family metallo-hydrolase n=1 Tax=Sphingomonas sp. TaxID=28214 RepID=UPI001DE6DB92|nr:M20/M25/M40 family metallo-hydrolase [Sphingomonas sp.]MBX9796803.1 M20/M25/M40 family metallo-hydrolase [Sphingomonas sp.]